jgi:PAS domain S-box-containing protein
MNPSISINFREWPERLAGIAGSLVCLIGVLVLLGCALDIAVFKNVLPQWPQMAPGAALAFVLAGMALVLLTVGSVASFPEEKLALSRSLVVRGCAGFVALIGLLKVSEYLMGWDLSIDHLFFKESPRAVGAGTLGRIAPATALNLLFLGSAIYLATGKRPSRVFQFLTLLCGLIGWLGFSHFLYGGDPLLPYTKMAIHTAAAFVILSAGLLCVRSDVGLMALLVSDSAGGLIARRILPPALLAPIVLAWLRLEGQHAGWYGTEAWTSLYALSNVIVFGVLVWAAAALLHRADVGRRQAEQSVRDSQRLLQAIIDNSPAVIYVKDLEGRYLLINRRFSELFHISDEEIAGKTDYDLFPKEAADAFRAMDERVAAAATALKEEEVAPLDDGPHTYVSVKSPLRDSAGNPYAVFGISTDITERKLAEEALRASEERTRLIIETALDAVITIDSAGVISGWNPQAETAFGWTSQQAIGHSLAETIIPESHREAHQRGIHHYLTTGEAAMLNKRIELTALHRDGHEIPVELAITSIRLGGALSFSAFVRDITERKRAEGKLWTQLERLNLLHQITRATGERQDLQSIFEVVIRSLEDHLPLDFGCVCLYEPADNALTVASVGVRSVALATELAMTEQARIPIDENGLSHCVRGQLVHEPDVAETPFPFPQRLSRSGLHSLVAAPLLVENKVFGILVAARRQPQSFSSGECEFLKQLSEHIALAAHQAQLYAALQRAYDELRETQQAVMQQERLRALGQMASGIAHDINNAISPVALYTESLLEKEPNLSVRARDYLETIQHSIQDVAQTIARLREFYRQREPLITLTQVDLNRLVQQVLELTRARWSDMPQQRGIVIEILTELSPDLPIIMGSESEIREALINLIFNSVDAMPDGGTLALRTRAVESPPDSADVSALCRVQVEVTDTGIGMDEDTRSRCLEPFFTTKGERGTGLGLAMVYGMVQRHSAEIEIEGAIGEGIMVRLSFAVPTITVGALAQSAAVSPVPSPLRILVVDDDPVLLKSLRNTLEADGHSIFAANDGQGGIDAFRAAQESGEVFDLVITDLGMPYVDGRKVANTVKEASPNTPVILLTGWGHRMVSEGNVPPHVDCVLNKPPKLRELREALALCCHLADV